MSAFQVDRPMGNTMKKFFNKVLQLVLILNLTACSAQASFLNPEPEQPQVIQEIAVSEKEVTIIGTSPLVYFAHREYNNSPIPELVVLLKETGLGQYREPLIVKKGAVAEIIPRKFVRRNQWGTELKIAFNQDVEYQFREEGNRLIITLKETGKYTPPPSIFKEATLSEPGADPTPEPEILDRPASLVPPGGNPIKREVPPKDSGDYVIGPEDILEIQVWKNDDLSKVVAVRPDGYISLPLIGEVNAAGSTPAQLRDEIVRRVSQYQKVSEVSVIIKEINSYNVYILGEVARPGKYAIKNNATLLQVISLAGGFTSFASLNQIKVLRRIDGQPQEQIFRIRYKDIISSEDSSKNMILKPGDTIIVP
jgi:polysaccharide biosynthesis/export protein